MTLGPKDPGVRLAIGVSGAGKSHGVTRDVLASARAGVRVIVIDPMHEWSSVPPDLARATIRVKEISEAHEAFKRADGLRLAIFTPVPETEPEAAEQACKWALASKELRGVTIHEAWMVAPSQGSLPPSFLRVTRAWRHRNVAMWLDAQRISQLSRHVTELARELRMYAATGDRDFAVLQELGGKQLVEAVRECARRYADPPDGLGQPGWFVELGTKRIGPYPIRRSPA